MKFFNTSGLLCIKFNDLEPIFKEKTQLFLAFISEKNKNPKALS